MRRASPFAACIALVSLAMAACGSDEAATEDSTEETPALDASEFVLGDVNTGTFDDGAVSFTLDDVEYDIDIEYCVRSPFGMSGFGRGVNGEKLTFSYETGDPSDDSDDDDDAELDNSIQFESADGNSDWRAGWVSGPVGFRWGSIVFTLQENTIEGTGGFENTYDPGSLPVDGAFSITCE